MENAEKGAFLTPVGLSFPEMDGALDLEWLPVYFFKSTYHGCSSIQCDCARSQVIY